MNRVPIYHSTYQRIIRHISEPIHLSFQSTKFGEMLFQQLNQKDMLVTTFWTQCAPMEAV